MATTGVLTAVLSTASFASFVTGIGAIIGAPIAGIAAVMGLFSTTAGVGSERLNSKVTKHETTVSLAESQHLSVSRLVSKALTDGSITDVEFNLILREIEKKLKIYEAMRRLRL